MTTKPKAPTTKVTTSKKPTKPSVLVDKEATVYRPTQQIMDLCKILKMKRPHGSATEQAFCNQYLEPIAGATKDGFGNYHVIVPHKTQSNGKLVLFSAHTDTVHANGGEQTVLIDEVNGEAFIDSRGKKGKDGFGECLGADDGTGCWLLLNMIANGVPGYYIFHRAEECGGQGSKYIRDNWQKVMGKREFDIAIAFDRKGTDEIITHQKGRRCASDTAAAQIAEMFQKRGMLMRLSDRGSFTDTANYEHLIPECFNLAVGYDKQHGPNETQDLNFAEMMLDACLALDWNALKAHRDPKVYEPSYPQDGWGNQLPVSPPKKKKKAVVKKPLYEDLDPTAGPDTPASYEDLASFISYHPLAAIEVMKQLGVSEGDILDAIEGQNMQGMALFNDLTARHFGA